jgi:hypothetical protein
LYIKHLKMSFSINSVRNTVLFLLKKNNYGSLEPSAFNSYCEISQLSIFESLFYSNNLDSIKKTNRLTNSQYADLKKIREEQIDLYSMYSTPSNFIYDPINEIWKFTENNLYKAIELSLVNIITKKKVNIDSNLKSKLNYAINSNINTPTVNFPEYCRVGEDFKVYPINPNGYYVELFYLRKPKTPKWTYTLVQGNPLFNASASDLQDIDLHISLFERFVVRVCAYAGLSLKDGEVTQATASEESLIMQKQS